MKILPMIIGIDGSPVLRSRVSGMLETVMKELEDMGAETRTIKLSEHNIRPHSGNLEEKDPGGDIKKLKELLVKSDGMVLATPTHWFNMSGHMKIFLDRLTDMEHRGFLLEGRGAGIITYGPEGGALSAAQTMLMIASQWGLVVPPYGAVFDEGRGDKWVQADLKLLAKNLLQIIKATKKADWDYSK